MDKKKKKKTLDRARKFQKILSGLGMGGGRELTSRISVMNIEINCNCVKRLC